MQYKHVLISNIEFRMLNDEAFLNIE